MFIGHKVAVVSDISWTTRDIVEFEYNDKNNKLTYIIADSWWLDYKSNEDEVSKDIISRTDACIDESDLVIWIIEYDKITKLDEYILKLFRKKKFNDVIVVANKADNEEMRLESYNLSWIGWFKDFFPVSVSHNYGITELKKFISDTLTKKWLNFLGEKEDENLIKLAVVWRPNVWKSSLINTITWKNRVMVKDFAGTTRDSIDTAFDFEDNKFTLIDTAWLRRASKVWVRNIEDRSVLRTDRSIIRSQVVAMIIDWVDGIVHLDQSIISKILDEKKWIILVVNKWDKVLEKEKVDPESMMNKYITYLKSKLEFLPYVPVLFVSALNWKRVNEILKMAVEVNMERTKRVKTSVFNDFIEQVVYKHPPTWNKKSHKPKIYYGSQVDVNPPKFLLSVNNDKHFHFSYKRYLENRIRENFWFKWTPIVIEYKGKTKD